MSKKSWGGAGAWAADSELAESEEASMPAPLPTIVDASAFPSLGEAASAKVSKKKKPQAVPFAKFIAAKPVSLSDSKGLTYEDMVMLPTGPRDRSGEEITPGGLGGGFRDYGGFRGDRDGGGRRSDRDGGRDGGFGRESGFGRDSGDEPSRADNVDDWGATKKFVPSGSMGGGGGTGRYDDDAGGRRRMGDFSSSKADEDSHWGSSKKFTPAVPAGTGDRRASKYDFSARNGIDTSKSVVDEVENWASAKRPSVVAPSYDSFSNRDKDFGLPRDRDGADGDKWVRNRDRDGSRPLSASKERPRLVLQPRTQQPSDTSAPLVAKEEPSPLEDQPSSDETVVTEKPARKINPFGEAKPREVVLLEKGLNWKHLDTDVDPKSVDRTSEELALKEEIKRIEDAIKEKEAEREGKENDDEDEEAKKVIEELKEELIQSQEKLENLTLSSEKKENGRATDAWSRNSSNGRPSVIPPPERRGGRW